MDYQLHDLQINNLHIYQSDQFFKFGTDAVALANFAKPKPKDIAVDIGTGSGVIPILLAGKFGTQHAYGIEIQKELCDMANKSIEYNRLSDKISIINAPAQDFQSIHQQDPQNYIKNGKITLVTANPPYAKVGSGDPTRVDSIAMSRFEYSLSLQDTIQTAQTLLSTGGRFCMIHKISRMAEVITQCSNAKLEPKRLQLLGTKLFLVECKKDAAVGLLIN